jgi:hypothetical protein
LLSDEQGQGIIKTRGDLELSRGWERGRVRGQGRDSGRGFELLEGPEESSSTKEKEAYGNNNRFFEVEQDTTSQRGKRQR